MRENTDSLKAQPHSVLVRVMNVSVHSFVELTAIWSHFSYNMAVNLTVSLDVVTATNQFSASTYQTAAPFPTEVVGIAFALRNGNCPKLRP